MQIKFCPELYVYTCGFSSIEAKGATVGECIEYTFNKFPQLLVFLTSNNAIEATKLSIKLNDDYIFEPESLWQPVINEDIITFGKDVPEGEGSAAKIIAGVVLIAVGAILNFTPFAAASPYFYMMGGSMILGGLAEMVVGTPKLPGSADSNSSPTYSFSGIRNTTAPGTPVPIVYGTHRVGGHLTNVYTQVLFDQNNYLFAQLALSEGEVSNIQNIELNGRAAEDFQDCSLYWRSGTSEQLPPEIPLTSESNDTYILNWDGNKKCLFTSRAYDESGGYLHYTPLTINNTQGTAFNQVILNVYNEYDRSRLLEGQFYIWLETLDGQMLSTSRKSMYMGGDQTSNITLELSSDYYGDFNICTYTIPIPTYEQWNESGTSIYTEPYWYGIFWLNSVTMVDTKSQTRDNLPAMNGFNTIQNTTTYNIPITGQQDDYTSGGAWVATRTQVSSIYLTIVAPMLVSYNSGATVKFKVGYRPVTKSIPSDYVYTLVTHAENTPPELFSISHPTGTSSEVYKCVTIDDLPIGLWEIIVWRETTDNGGNINIVDSIILKDVTEVTIGGEVYPYTSLLGIKIKASDQLSGSLPVITSLLDGVKVALPVNYDGVNRDWPTLPWDGTLTYDEVTGIGTKYWTNNPVWCLYDLIVNKRFGLGNYFKISPEKRGLMLANFMTMANYCDERLTDLGVPPNTPELFSVTIAGDRIRSTLSQENRYRFSLDIVLDESKSAIEWLNTICSTMRATLFYTEGCVFIDIDRPKPVTQIFNMSSISEYTQYRSSRSGVPNMYEVQYIDKNNSYKSSLFTIEDPELQEDLDIEQRSKTLALIGVTDERQARSLAKYTLYTGKLARTYITFKTGTQGLRSMVGDVIGVQHDVPQWGVSGKIKSWDSITQNLTINEPLKFEWDNNGEPYQYSICIQPIGGEPVFYGIEEPILTGDILADAKINGWETYVIKLSTDSDGVLVKLINGVPAANFEALNIIPAAGDNYIISLTTNSVKAFKVVSLKRDSDEKLEVTALEYVEELYSSADNISTVSGVAVPLYGQIDTPIKRSVQSVVVKQKIYEDSTGVYKTGILLTYTVPTDVYWAGATVWYGIGSYSSALPVNRDGYVFIPEAAEAGDYQFAVVSQYSDGTRQSITEATAGGALGTLHVEFTKPLANLFLTGVSGLSIENKANDTTFTGRDCVVSWNKPLIYDPDIAAGEETSGAGTISTNNLFSYYLLEIYSIDGSLRRTVKLTYERYTYTHEQNHEDGVTRNFNIAVSAVDIYGRSSVVSSIFCTNPAPAAIT